jgi:hypothetical protein
MKKKDIGASASLSRVHAVSSEEMGSAGILPVPVGILPTGTAQSLAITFR